MCINTKIIQLHTKNQVFPVPRTCVLTYSTDFLTHDSEQRIATNSGIGESFGFVGTHHLWENSWVYRTTLLNPIKQCKARQHPCIETAWGKVVNIGWQNPRLLLNTFSETFPCISTNKGSDGVTDHFWTRFWKPFPEYQQRKLISGQKMRQEHNKDLNHLR